MKRAVFYIFSSIISLLMSQANTHAQETIARMSLDSTSILIGDQVGLHLEFEVPLNSKVWWPFFENDTVATGVEIIQQLPVDSNHVGEKVLRIHQKLIITSFDTGYITIDPVPFKFQVKGDTTEYLIQSNPVFLEVTEPEIDMAKDIKIIKPPLEAPITFQEIMHMIGKWIVPLFIVLIITGIIFYIVLRRRKNKPIFPVRTRPSLPPHKQALLDLEKLSQKKLWQSGRVKDYYTELTDIIRIYIENRFGVQALEMTTDEIFYGLKETTSIEEEQIIKLRQTLVIADLVKFAKGEPLPTDNDYSLQKSMEFVQVTKPEPEVKNEDNNKAEEKKEE